MEKNVPVFYLLGQITSIYRYTKTIYGNIRDSGGIFSGSVLFAIGACLVDENFDLMGI